MPIFWHGEETGPQGQVQPPRARDHGGALQAGRGHRRPDPGRDPRSAHLHRHPHPPDHLGAQGPYPPSKRRRALCLSTAGGARTDGQARGRKPAQNLLRQFHRKGGRRPVVARGRDPGGARPPGQADRQGAGGRTMTDMLGIAGWCLAASLFLPLFGRALMPLLPRCAATRHLVWLALFLVLLVLPVLAWVLPPQIPLPEAMDAGPSIPVALAADHAWNTAEVLSFQLLVWFAATVFCLAGLGLGLFGLQRLRAGSVRFDGASD